MDRGVEWAVPLTDGVVAFLIRPTCCLGYSFPGDMSSGYHGFSGYKTKVVTWIGSKKDDKEN
jgi:hypothetical protein